MKLILTNCFIILFSCAVFAQTHTLIAEQSELKWTGRAYQSDYALSGTVDVNDGVISMKKNTIESVEMDIDMAGLSHENKQLDKHLRNSDFFKVKKHKTATFTLTEVIDLKNEPLVAKGNLTIKGITHPIEFPITIEAIKKTVQVKGKMIVDRTQYGITTGSKTVFPELTEHLIDDNFDLVFDLVFKKM